MEWLTGLFVGNRFKSFLELRSQKNKLVGLDRLRSKSGQLQIFSGLRTSRINQSGFVAAVARLATAAARDWPLS
ncbi:MAG: hypothetical protein N3E45_08520 [Oscillatoriaceae bacterium SKW80]|nr:hypothetical protein [Oscillatoriaceae bacterium SKYG93]MCX8120864.1 hypothetical protein [Oscillatoriaceae bacterium SKW80]MDW8454205.1 hypothetical protein [Oscillatoriaceae cyanobacterium SKYGB_i_bin93]HIK26470.1 hypothetical protein [Oscillatoriaceae cyanobacterium M7585_C2015_266]